jgi:cytochrome c biogenesis protein CcdA
MTSLNEGFAPGSVVTPHRDRMDRVATVTAAACGIHCALSPILVPIIPLVAGRFVGSGLEWGFTVISLALGVASLGHSYRALHRNIGPIACFCAGFAMLLLARLVESRVPALELPAIAVGASSIMLAHVLNLRIRRRVRRQGCACPCHDDDGDGKVDA